MPIAILRAIAAETRELATRETQIIIIRRGRNIARDFHQFNWEWWAILRVPCESSLEMKLPEEPEYKSTRARNQGKFDARQLIYANYEFIAIFCEEEKKGKWETYNYLCIDYSIKGREVSGKKRLCPRARVSPSFDGALNNVPFRSFLSHFVFFEARWLATTITTMMTTPTTINSASSGFARCTAVVKVGRELFIRWTTQLIVLLPFLTRLYFCTSRERTKNTREKEREIERERDRENTRELLLDLETPERKSIFRSGAALK